MKYRVYRNMPLSACNVEADSLDEAIAKAEGEKDWEEYEQTDDDVTYEAVNMDILDKSEKEKRLMAWGAIEVVKTLLNILEKNWEGYSSSDDVLRADDWLKWANGEIGDDEAQIACKGLTGFNF